MWITMTNRGSQLYFGNDKAEAQRIADDINARNGAVFAWVQSAHSGAVQEDMPGRGVFYG